MKILILTNKPPYPPKDGGAIAVFNLSKGIAELGNEVHILSYNTSKHKVDEKSIPTFSNLKFTFVDLNTNIKPAQAFKNFLFSSTPYNAARFINKSYLDALKNILEKERFDIIQMEGPYLWFCFKTIKKYSQAKISLRGHNIEHEIWHRTALAEKNILKKIYIKNLANRIQRFEHSIINQYDFVLPITSRDGKIFEQMGNNKPLHVVPAGINVMALSAKSSEISNALFYIGALDWIPNQEGLLWFVDNAWPMVLKQYPNAIFHVAGRNAPAWFSPRITVKNVMYHGEIDDAYTYMQQAGIMIVPLFSGSGMRVKIVEGMALGKAIVSSSVGVEGIEVTDEKEVLIADDENRFAQKIVSLLENKELTRKISINARKCALEKYDNHLIAKNLVDFYTQQLNQE